MFNYKPAKNLIVDAYRAMSSRGPSERFAEATEWAERPLLRPMGKIPVRRRLD